MRILAMLAVLLSCNGASAEPRPGDIVFHRSSSRQSAVIAEVTGSALTHTGIVFERNGRLFVFEAERRVEWTPWEEWRERGAGGDYEVRRLPKVRARDLVALRRQADRYLGRRYDARFEWSDRRMYCSELVWKIYERALGVRLSEPQRWRDLTLSARAQALARARLGRLPPPNAEIVTPVAIAQSDQLYDPGD
jgi:hypothetical protein